MSTESSTLLTLQNEQLSLEVLPNPGGRILRLQDRASGKDWLWRPVAPPASVVGEIPYGAPFDDHWFGGWEEMFPNDAATQMEGKAYPDHGEIWSRAWKLESSSDLEVNMSVRCRTVPVEVRKAIRLHTSEPKVEVHYTFRNLSDRLVPYMLKLHPALAIEPGDQVLMPPCRIEPVELGFSSIIGRPGKTNFPYAYTREGSPVRLDRVPPRDVNEQEFVYASDLADGWCGLRSASTGRSLMFRFDRAKLPYVWVFQSFNKWRNHFVMMLEPCSAVPYDLGVAYKNGTCSLLQPNASETVSVHVEMVA